MSAHTSQTELKLIGKLILEGEMHCETGLHVGAGKGSLEIGGVGQSRGQGRVRPAVRAGQLAARQDSARCWSSRSGLAVPSELVYLSRRKGQEVRIHQSDRPDDEICLLFGRNPGRMERVQGETLDTSQATPARLAVYDAPLDPGEHHAADAREPRRRADRSEERERHRPHHLAGQSADAGAGAGGRAVPHPHGDGRAVRGGRALFARVLEGLRLLEDDALGGGGSRGSGRVRFAKLKLTWRESRILCSGRSGEGDRGGGDSRGSCSRRERRRILAGRLA